MEMDIAFGPIAEFISDKTIEEIWINSPQRIFIARAGKSELTNLILSPEEVSQLVDRLLKTS
jgi:pilus assembly protein CpaF